MKKKAPQDENQIAASIMESVKRLAAEPARINPPTDAETRSAIAKMLGSLGGKKGGKERAKNLGKAGLSEAMSKAVNARWDKVLTPERRRELARLRREKARKQTK